MALLRQRGGGLLATGPDAVRVNAMREQQRLLGAARAPTVIRAPSTIIQEENPLNSLGQGLGQLGKSLGQMALQSREQQAREAFSVAGDDVSKIAQVAAAFPSTAAGKQAAQRAQQQRGILAADARQEKSLTAQANQAALDRNLRIIEGRLTREGQMALARFNASQRTERDMMLYENRIKELREQARLAREKIELEADIKSGEGFGRPGSEKYEEFALKLKQNFDKGKEIQKYREVEASVRTIEQGIAVKSLAGDVNLVFAIAQAFDPGSVVRPGEYDTIASAQGLNELIRGAANAVQGGNRLTDKVRQELLKVAKQRLASRRPIFVRQAKDLRDRAARAGIASADVGLTEADFSNQTPLTTYTAPQQQPSIPPVVPLTTNRTTGLRTSRGAARRTPQNYDYSY